MILLVEVKAKPSEISEETMKEMTEFFMNTSIPRIIEAKRKEQEENHAIK